MQARRVLPLVALGTVILCACPAAQPLVLDVSIDQDLSYLVTGETRHLTATVTTSGGADQGVTWSSSDPLVALVDATGLVGAIAPGTATITATSVADPTRSDGLPLPVHDPGASLWTHQFGTDAIDQAHAGATAPGGDSFAAGTTYGDLAGPTFGARDAFLRRVDAEGQEVWTRQFGSPMDELVASIAVMDDGDVVVVGSTGGELFGDPEGDLDAFVAAFGPDGAPRWARQFGTDARDDASGVAVAPDGTIFVAGRTFGALEGGSAGAEDVFLRAYGADGGALWTRQIGTPYDDAAYAVAVDAAGRPVVVGATQADVGGEHAGGWNAAVWAFDATGATRWTRRFGADGIDIASAVAVDADGDVVIAGWTDAGLFGPANGGIDAFVRRLDPDGTPRWARQFGTAAADSATAVVVDVPGRVVVAGTTWGDLAGGAGGADGFLGTFTDAGDVLSTHQFGTSGGDFVTGLAADGDASVFTFGQTSGALGDTNPGNIDAFVRKSAR
jgi:hypothetical protein